MKSVVVIFFLAIAVFVGVNRRGNEEVGSGGIKEIFAPSVTVEPSPSPIPFQELTIPYLRSREYVSQLGELRQYQDNSLYTTYLTSYDSDGLQVNGLLTVPKSEGPHPAIVFVHGYIAPTVYRTTERYSDHVNYLARNGFVVFKIDLRGHDQSEGLPGGSYYSGDYVVDTLNAYSALQGVEFVDSTRVGLWGHSMAGNITFRSMVAKQDIPATVIWAGAGFTYDDLRAYRIMDTSYRPPSTNTEVSERRARLRELHGEFDGSDPFWQQVTPVNYLEGVSGAVQLNHAIDDNVVSIEYSRNLAKALGGTNIVFELKEYGDGGHNIAGSAFGQAMRNTVDFYQTYLK